MADIMVEHKGIGLAGPQVGVPLRIFIISLDGTKENVRAYINPTVKTIGKTTTSEEGCLSVPGVYTKIRRFKRCSVTATDLDGNEFTEEADGMYARCLQHEFDHINGITIADKMGTVAKIAHRKTLQELKEQQEK
jgi:peptide deformylase